MIGSNDPVFTLTLDSSNKSGDQMELAMAQYLRDRGYTVGPPNEHWETVAAFCARVGIRAGHFRRALDHVSAPAVLTHRGPTGRVLQLLSTPVFDAFCRRNKPQTGTTKENKK